MKKKEIIGGIVIYLIGLIFIIGMFINAEHFNEKKELSTQLTTIENR